MYHVTVLIRRPLFNNEASPKTSETHMYTSPTSIAQNTVHDDSRFQASIAHHAIDRKIHTSSRISSDPRPHTAPSNGLLNDHRQNSTHGVACSSPIRKLANGTFPMLSRRSEDPLLPSPGTLQVSEGTS
ncbi:hypothetical protein WAI453_011707 [Rhynchosporium graminicola]